MCQMVSQENLDLSCHRDLVASIIISSCTKIEGYTPQEDEISQVFLLIEVLEEKIAKAMWVEHFESLLPKIKLAYHQTFNFGS